MKVHGFKRLQYLLPCLLFFTAFGCGYQFIGAKALPFQSVTIMPVKNKTHEPYLEEKLHDALSREFIANNIRVMTYGGDIELTATVTTFELSTIAARDEKVQEQAITMRVDVRIIDKKDKVIEFTSLQSPIKITFQAVGAVSAAVVQKEKAVDKACTETARELLSRLALRYAK